MLLSTVEGKAATNIHCQFAMDPSEWDTVDQVRIRIKERYILKVSKLWGNKSVAQQFLAKEVPTWPRPAALRGNPGIPQQGTALTK